MRTSTELESLGPARHRPRTSRENCCIASFSSIESPANFDFCHVKFPVQALSIKEERETDLEMALFASNFPFLFLLSTIRFVLILTHSRLQITKGGFIGAG